MSRPQTFASLLSAALAVVALLCFPAASLAGDRQGETGESSVTALSTAGLLSRGSGYESRDGSAAVSALQVRLRRLGHAPGPVDGLFGPRTEGAVERFQLAKGLVVDGLVGPRTRGRLLPRPPKPAPPGAGSVGPLPQAPADPAVDSPRPEPIPAPDAAPAADPEPSGLAPGYAALLGAFVAALAAVGLSALRGVRRPSAREGRINLGLVGAVLLAVFAMGTAGGAVFATRSAPSDFDDAQPAALRATTPDRPRAVTSVAERPRPVRRATRAAATPRRHARGEARRAAAAAPAPRTAAAPAGRRAAAAPAERPTASSSAGAPLSRAPAAPTAPPSLRIRTRPSYTRQPVDPAARAASRTPGASAGERLGAP
jgi:hypothetical protein